VLLPATSLFAILQHANDTGRQERCLPFDVISGTRIRLAFGVWRLAFGVWRLAFGVWRFAFRVSRFAFRVSRFAFRVSRFAFRVSRFAFRVSFDSLRANSGSKVTINPEPHPQNLEARD
jgi:hypothetical protein